MINPRRRRRRRSRNPISPYASSGYYRRPNRRRRNPAKFSFNEIMDIVPAATAGVLAQRFALRQAGAFEAGKDGVLEPGLKHAIALWAGAEFGSEVIESIFGAGKGNMARISAYGFAGDFFLRTKLARNNEFLQNNFSLQGLGYDDDTETNDYYEEADPDYVTDPSFVSGFQATSVLGDYVDAFGQRYERGSDGQWALAGAGSGARLAGFSPTSILGNVPPVRPGASSFGYSR
jgi:hypothetical protein